MVRIGFRMRSRLHEMCEFLEFDGADFRHAPSERRRRRPADDVEGQSRAQVAAGADARPGPRAAQGPRSRTAGRKRELGWSGGKAGS